MFITPFIAFYKVPVNISEYSVTNLKASLWVLGTQLSGAVSSNLYKYHAQLEAVSLEISNADCCFPIITALRIMNCANPERAHMLLKADYQRSPVPHRAALADLDPFNGNNDIDGLSSSLDELELLMSVSPSPHLLLTEIQHN